MDRPRLFTHVSVDEHLGRFHCLPILINAVMNIYVQVCVWLFFIPLR